MEWRNARVARDTRGYVACPPAFAQRVYFATRVFRLVAVHVLSIKLENCFYERDPLKEDPHDELVEKSSYLGRRLKMPGNPSPLQQALQHQATCYMSSLLASTCSPQLLVVCREEFATGRFCQKHDNTVNIVHNL